MNFTSLMSRIISFLSSYKSFSLTAFSMVITRALGLLLNFTSTYVLIRVLTLETYGEFIFFTSVLTLFASPVSSAIMQLTTRMFSITSHHSEAVRWVNQKISLWMSIVILIGTTTLFAEPILINGYVLLAVCVGAYLLLLSSIYQGFNNGKHFVALSQTQEQVLRPVVFLSSVLLAKILFSASLESVILLYVASIAVALLISYFFGKNYLEIDYPRFVPTIRGLTFKSSYDKSFYLFASTVLATTLLAEINIFVLKGFGFTETIALYAVAMKIINLVLIVNIVIVQIVSPRISSLYFSGNLRELINYIKFTTRLSFVSTFILSVIVYSLFDELFLFFLEMELPGTFFNGFLALLGAQLCNVACGPVVKLLLMTGNEKQCLISMVVSILLASVSAIILIPLSPFLGAMGAAAIGIISWNLLLTLVVKSKLGFNASIV